MRASLKCLAVCSGLMVGATASAFNGPPPYPRLAISWISNQTYADPNVQAQLGRADLAIILTWPGWANGQSETLQQAVQGIKSHNPNMLVFEYVKNNEIDGTIASNGVYSALFNKLNAQSWYLYASGTTGVPLPSTWAGATSINNTLFTAKDSNGDNWLSWSAKFFVQTFATPAPALDGFSVDNVFWKPRVAGDWNLDGVTDSTDAATSGQWQRQGYASYFQQLHSLMPGKYQIGNIADWGDPAAVLTEYQGALDGGVIEALIGQPYSPEAWGSWSTMLAWYRKAMSALGGPKLGIFAQVGNPTDYQSFRYGFATCLLDNGYYQFNGLLSNGQADNGSMPWFDEFNYKGQLGLATSNPPTAAWQNGVWRRDFANGIALVNPKGNGPQTVTLETAYKRLTGTQAPTINSGQSVTTLTLQDRDGIILLRPTAQKKPLAPGNISAKP